MPRYQRVFVAACAGVIGFCVAYVASDFGPLPKPIYTPGGGWAIAPRPAGAVPIGYYGMLLWGAGGAAVAAAAAYAALGWRRAPVPERWLHLLAGWAATAAALAAAYFLWNLWPF
ncbi:MAG: hypothetical protein D6689_04315 [Deltaproteobacteria bacterium]|nr:MAG: hypothetical protein D6689_04315 [Deltaproteobacteria bacterium]